MGYKHKEGLLEERKTTLAAIAQAFQLSAHILLQDSNQLTGQMVGRLLGLEAPGIQSLIQHGITRKETPWLRPLAPSLTPPGGPLLSTLAGHKDQVYAVAVTPDGQRAVSGSDDQTLKVWNLENGEVLHTLKGHTSPVLAVAVIPDGQLALSGSGPRGGIGNDKTLRVWDLQNGEVLRTLRGHTSDVTTVAITPDGQLAVSTSMDGTLKVWDMETGEIMAFFTVEGSIKTCAVAPDGLTFVAGDHAGQVHFLRLENITPGAHIVTSRRHHPRSLRVRCPLCMGSSEIEGSDLGCVISCPDCGAALRVNPFVVEQNPRNNNLLS